MSDDSAAKDADHQGQSDESGVAEPTGLNGRTYPQHEELINQLPPKFQEGVRALQRQDRCQDARIVTVSKDRHKGGAGFVFISLGVWQITRFDEYDHDEAEVFIRLKENFPDGKKYGFITDPVVQVDGQYPDGRTEINRELAEPLIEALDVDEVLVWSRDWRHLDVTEPEDMTKALGWTRQVLSEPFEEN